MFLRVSVSSGKLLFLSSAFIFLQTVQVHKVSRLGRHQHVKAALTRRFVPQACQRDPTQVRCVLNTPNHMDGIEFCVCMSSCGGGEDSHGWSQAQDIDTVREGRGWEEHIHCTFGSRVGSKSRQTGKTSCHLCTCTL